MVSNFSWPQLISEFLVTQFSLLLLYVTNLLYVTGFAKPFQIAHLVFQEIPN